MPTSIRSEQPADHAAIAAVQRAAFARDAEANLVSALRHDGLMLVSLVALHGEIIIGHVMFSTLRVEVSGRELVAPPSHLWLLCQISSGGDTARLS